jgi:hypothetical protein
VSGRSRLRTGCGWFVILLVRALPGNGFWLTFLQNLGCLVVASIIVALAARTLISSADSFGEYLLRAAVIPYLGCLVYLSLSAGLLWLQTFLYGGLANVHDTLSLYVMGLSAAAISFFVVIPYGLLCQYAMSLLSNTDRA